MFILRGAHWIPCNDSDTMSSWGWAQVLFEVPPSLPPHGRRYSEDRQEKSSNSVWLIFRYEASGSKVRYLISFEPFNMTMYIQSYAYIKIHIYEKIWIEIYISILFRWTLPCYLSRFYFVWWFGNCFFCHVCARWLNLHCWREEWTYRP